MKASRSAARRGARAQSREGRRQALPVILLGLCECLAALFQAWCVARILADGLGGLLGSGQPPGALSALLGFAVAGLLRAGLQAMAEILSARAGSRARARLRHDTMQRILSDGPRLLHSTHSGALTTLVVDRIEAVDGFFARYLPAATLAFAAPVLVLLAAALVQPFAAIVLLCCGIAVPVLQAAFGIGAAAAARRQFQALARLQTRFVDRMRGIATIVLAGRTEDEARRLAVAADELRVRTMRVLRVAFLSSAALDCAAAVALVMLALHFAGRLAATPRDVSDIARALIVLLLVPEFFAPLRAFAAAYQDRSQAAAAAAAIASLPPAPPVPEPLPVRTTQARGIAVAFENVGLRWDPSRPMALDGVSFRLAAGETLVLAGPSGSGKSTLIEVLLGFVSPDSGRVTLNGADIATLVPQALSRLTAWIGQQPMLFAASIEDNIRFARPEASETELAAAVAFARLDSLAASLPQGLRTLIGEGGYGLSGGQAQRIAIARAFLKNAPLLLLDEPTSHLDPATEAEVLDSLRRLAIGRTVLIASHASAAHAFASRRLDLRQGRVVFPASAARGAA